MFNKCDWSKEIFYNNWVEKLSKIKTTGCSLLLIIIRTKPRFTHNGEPLNSPQFLRPIKMTNRLLIKKTLN